MQVRYNTRRDFNHPEKKLETRNEYLVRFGQHPVPEPDYPAVVSHVMQWFWELSSRRQYGASGPCPLTFTEIKAWLELTGTLIDPREVKMLLELDSAWLQVVAEESRQDKLRHEGMAQARRGLRG